MSTQHPRRTQAPQRPPSTSGPRHAPRVPFALLVFGLLGGGLVLLLALNTASAANELRRHDLAVRDADLAAALAQGRNDLAASAAPNVLAYAAGNLGMVPAGNPVFITIGPDGKPRVIGSGAPATPVALPPIPAPDTGIDTGVPATPQPTKPTPTPSGSHSGSTSTPTPTPTVTPTSTTTVTLPGGDR